MAGQEKRLRTVVPDLAELLPTSEARAAYKDSSASIEAGHQVRSFRQSANLTQAQLAERLGISQARVSAIETGEGRDGPSYALMKRIARACGAEWPVMADATPAADLPVRRYHGLPVDPVSASGYVDAYVAAISPLARDLGALKVPNVFDAAGRKVGVITEFRIRAKNALGPAAVGFDPKREQLVLLRGKYGSTGQRKRGVVVVPKRKLHDFSV